MTEAEKRKQVLNASIELTIEKFKQMFELVKKSTDFEDIAHLAAAKLLVNILEAGCKEEKKILADFVIKNVKVECVRVDVKKMRDKQSPFTNKQDEEKE